MVAKERFRQQYSRRTIFLCLLAIPLGCIAYGVSFILIKMIYLITNLSFYAQFSWQNQSPAHAHLGWWTIFTPAIGGIIVGIMARYGTAAIRGHGIPEAMEQILLNSSKVHWRVALFKPISSAIAIGTGGPFGAEGPIISTGGAFGSLFGQILPTTGMERRILLSAGAAAGMTAIFGAPISAVLLAIELLLFEFRLRSVAPVAVACAVTMTCRVAVQGSEATFGAAAAAFPNLNLTNFLMAIFIGVLMGPIGVYVSKAIYAFEDLYEKLPIHWMWWPAIGGLFVGIVGLIQPLVLGVGYTNIDGFLEGTFPLTVLASLLVWKLAAWLVSLSSGTSGGTLAPLFTIGGCIGALIGGCVHLMFPNSGLLPALAGLVGMAAIFASASGALFASAVFALETTRQWNASVPLLVACALACVIAKTLTDTTIMTEKIFRRGVLVPDEYSSDKLTQLKVEDVYTPQPFAFPGSLTIGEAKAYVINPEGPIRHHLPIVEADQKVIGVLTRAVILATELNPTEPLRALIERDPIVTTGSVQLRGAANLMIQFRVGCLPVVDENEKLVGIITRGDLMEAERSNLDEENVMERSSAKLDSGPPAHH